MAHVRGTTFQQIRPEPTSAMAPPGGAIGARRNTRWFIAVWLMCATALIGCSTLEVYDEYIVTGTDTEWVRFGDKGINIAARVLPDGRFTSLGVLGVPAIPVYASTKPQAALVLEVVLTLHVNHAFSFVSMPCLSAMQGPPICPVGVTISAKAMAADSGETSPSGSRRYGHIPQFYEPPWTSPLDLSLPRSPIDARITSDEILAHYHYFQEPPWIFLEARVAYRFECGTQCPSKFTVDMKDVAVIDAAFATSGTYTFDVERRADYQATRILQ